MNDSSNRGSEWRVWDLQVQTIIDDQYTPLSAYHTELKEESTELWNAYTAKVGGEENALLFDSLQYFGDTSVPLKDRCNNYARNLFAFVETYRPNVGLIGFTDHNYSHPELLDALNQFSSRSTCKCVCGVEINAGGVHMLVFFENPPFSKLSFADGIKTFLDKINVHNAKENGVLKVSDKSVIDVVNIVNEQDGITIFPHCNSDNGLFQERGKTDRTHLADMYNHGDTTFLQSRSKESAEKVGKYIDGQTTLTSKNVFSISGDSRCLRDIGNSDDKGNYTWIKADTTFKGLRQLLIENSRVSICDIPEFVKRVNSNKTKFIRSLEIKKLDGVDIEDVWFDNFKLELNSGLVAIIGNKGGGKSAITDIISLCGNTYQKPDNFSFLDSKKFRKTKPYNLSERFIGTITWHDGIPQSKKLNENPDTTAPERVKYIPQNFLEHLCANIESEDFEKEIKQIIFSHTPSDQRLGKSTLDELINFKSGIVASEIAQLLIEVSAANLKIVELEQKDSKANRQAVANNVQLKKDQLSVHQTIRPEAPVSSGAIISTDLIEKLTLLRENIAEKEKEIQRIREGQAVLRITLEQLSRSLQHYKGLGEQLQKETREDGEFVKALTQNGIELKDVFTYTINTAPIASKILDITGQITTIDVELNPDNKEGKMALLAVLQLQLLTDQDELDKPAKDYQKHLDALKEWTDKKTQIEGSEHEEGSLQFHEKQLAFLNTEVKSLIETKYEERRTLIKKLFELKQNLINIRKELYEPVSHFISEFKDLNKHYAVKLDVTLELKSFTENFFGFVNQARVGTFIGKEDGYKRLLEIIDRANFSEAGGFVDFAEELLDNLKHDKKTEDNAEVDINTSLRQGKELNQLYDFLFQYEYLQPAYSLKLGQKTLEELSPGERGALLLIFYLILDKDDIPLIIDQPEENLDNESVYYILVHFIKKVKEHRQIIIVTHNPNLAIVCDADQIVHMQIEKDKKNTVKFYSGAIEDLQLNQSAVNILEGTMLAFNNRDAKYFR